MRRASGRIWTVVETAVEAAGFDLVGVEFGGKPGDRILRVYIDREGGVDIDDCATASRQLSVMLDVDEPIEEAYVLEVSSPGVDRPLFRREDYARFAGETAFIRLAESFEGRRRFKGVLGGIDGDTIEIEVDGHKWHLPADAVEEAHLIGRI